MKIRITMKTPDALNDSISDAELEEEDEEVVRKIANQYFSYGEYVTIEIDTEFESIALVKK